MNTAQKIAKTPAKVAGFELDDLDKVEQITHRVTLVADEEGNPVTGLIIVGRDSPEFIAATRQVRADNMKRAAMRKKAIDTKTDEGTALVIDTVARNETFIALAVTVGWFGFLTEGAERTFDKTLVAKLFEKKPTWQNKVTVDLEEDANFTKA